MISRLEEILRRASLLMQTDHFSVSCKDGIENIVTSSDLLVQDFLKKELGALLPGSGFFCEEDEGRDSDKEYIWIIDPIDGTANYSRSISDCCISVALSHRGKLELGAVFSPSRGEMYTAVRGKGAWCNSRPIHVSTRPFKEGILCTAMSTYRKEFAKTCSDIIFDIYMRSNDLRRWGSAALELCLLASGLVELYFEMRLQPWDYAAGGLILEEAGGHICSFDGAFPSLEKASLVIAANNEDSLSDLLSTVHRHMERLPY